MRAPEAALVVGIGEGTYAVHHQACYPAELARMEQVWTEVPGSGRFPRTGEPSRMPSVIGYRATLAPGFVVRGRAHPLGHPWYHNPEARKTGRRSRVRLPVVVTCRCGTDVLVSADEMPLDREAAGRRPMARLTE